MQWNDLRGVETIAVLAGDRVHLPLDLFLQRAGVVLILRGTSIAGGTKGAISDTAAHPLGWAAEAARARSIFIVVHDISFSLK